LLSTGAPAPSSARGMGDCHFLPLGREQPISFVNQERKPSFRPIAVRCLTSTHASVSGGVFLVLLIDDDAHDGAHDKDDSRLRFALSYICTCTRRPVDSHYHGSAPYYRSAADSGRSADLCGSRGSVCAWNVICDIIFADVYTLYSVCELSPMPPLACRGSLISLSLTHS